MGCAVISERRVLYRPNLSNVIRVVSNEWMTRLAKEKPQPPSVQTARTCSLMRFTISLTG